MSATALRTRLLSSSFHSSPPAFDNFWYSSVFIIWYKLKILHKLPTKSEWKMLRQEHKIKILSQSSLTENKKEAVFLLSAMQMSFLGVLMLMTLNDVEIQKAGFQWFFSRFQAATNISTVNCPEIIGDRLLQPACTSDLLTQTETRNSRGCWGACLKHSKTKSPEGARWSVAIVFIVFYLLVLTRGRFYRSANVISAGYSNFCLPFSHLTPLFGVTPFEFMKKLYGSWN